MANPDHFKLFLQGPKVWNEWRKENPQIEPNLSGEFIYPHFARTNQGPLRKADVASSDPEIPFNFSRTNFHKSSFESTIFPNADMRECYLYETDMSRAGFPGADFSGSMIRKAYCSSTDFSKAIFVDCVLNNSTFIGTDFSGARLEGCNVYGVSAWEIILDEKTVQKELFLHRDNFSRKDIGLRSDVLSYVDDLALAQFFYFLNQPDGFGKSLKQLNRRSVLLLGKFKEGGLELLKMVGEMLRSRNYIPIVFDFDPSKHSNLIENVTTMAGLSRIVLANLEGGSVPAELARVTANYRNPVIGWIHDNKHESVYAMFKDVIALDNVQYFTYTNEQNLESQLNKFIAKAEEYIEKLSDHSSISNKKFEEGRIGR